MTGLLQGKQCISFKLKNNKTLPILVCNLLYATHKPSNQWPAEFVQVHHPCPPIYGVRTRAPLRPQQQQQNTTRNSTRSHAHILTQPWAV